MGVTERPFLCFVEQSMEVGFTALMWLGYQDIAEVRPGVLPEAFDILRNFRTKLTH